MQFRRHCAAGVAAFALGACAGNGDGLDANGRPIGEGGGGGPLVATFDSIQANVFTPICTTCHVGAAAPQGLRLDATNSYDLLVGVASNEVPALQRVNPGDPDHSYLIQKIEGHAAVGARMPLGGPYLDQTTIDVIRQWITDGAARTGTAVAAEKPFALALSAPANGETVAQAPGSLVLAFTHELDATRLDATHVHLTRLAPADAGSGMDQDASAGLALDVVPVRAQVVAANRAAVAISTGKPLEPGRYALQVDGAALADLGGHPLDGVAGSGTSSGVRVVFEVGGSPQ